MLTQVPNEVAVALRKRFTTNLPLLLTDSPAAVKAEMKPYLQPFERTLALRELRALLASGDTITEAHGLFVLDTDRSQDYLMERLTYWQRVGRTDLAPTRQTIIEFTQTGLEKASLRGELHSARRLRYGPHDIHEYRGKFFPQLVRSLINISGIDDDATVIDPMCGSGTTLCESIAFGRAAIGVDLNPLSVLISRVKSGVATERPDAFLRAVNNYIALLETSNASPSSIWRPDDLEYLHRWFDPVALTEIASVLTDIKKITSRLYRDFFRVCLSDIVRGISWQKDSDLRVRKEIRLFKPGSVFALLRAQIAEQRDRIYPYLCIMYRRRVKPTLLVEHGNSVDVDRLLPDYVRECNLLITSPPYATALPYLDTDRLSLIVLGLLNRKSHRELETQMVGTREVSERERKQWWELYERRREELPSTVCGLIDEIAEANHQPGVGFRRRNLPALLGKYFIDMLDAMSSARRMMAPNARGYYVVGNNSTTVGDEKIEIPTDQFLFEIGVRAGWRQDEVISMELIPSRDIFRENRGSAEAILAFRA